VIERAIERDRRLACGLAVDAGEDTSDVGGRDGPQRDVDAIWNTPRKWYSMAVRNTARMSWFSSDRTVRQYAEEIWDVPVPKS